MGLTALVVQLCEVARRRNLQTAVGERVFCLCLCSTLLTRQALVLPLSPAAFSASFPTSLLPISSQLQPSHVSSCTICTTCNPTRQTGGARQVSLLPSVAIDVILWNALHVPPTLTARLLPLVGAHPSCSYRLAHRLARLRQHRPDTLIMHCP